LYIDLYNVITPVEAAAVFNAIVLVTPRSAGIFNAVLLLVISILSYYST